jgi:hypothetical protein
VRWSCFAGPDRILIGAADGLFALAAPWSRQGYTDRMCIICVDLARQVMTAKDGRRALGEMRGKLDAAHIAEVEAKLAEAEKTVKPRP